MTSHLVQSGRPARREGLAAYLVGQFRRPSGVAGWLAGCTMALRSSNRRRNLWTLRLADIGPSDRVLEIGFGPGLALAAICRRLEGGRAVGLDHSPTMLRMASRRNREALRAGTLRLLLGSAEQIGPSQDEALQGPFDCIIAVNVAFFWSDPSAVLRTLADRLAPEGALFLTFQPRRTCGQTDLERLAARWSQMMEAAGLDALGFEEETTLSPPAICVFARSPVTR